MPAFFPLLALAVAAISYFALGDRSQPSISPEWTRIIAAIVLACICGIVAQQIHISTFPGLALAVVLAVACYWFGGKSIPIALAAAGVSALPMIAPGIELPNAQLGFLIASGLAALVLGGESAPRFAITALLAIAANRLGSMHAEAVAYQAIGSEFALAVAVGSLVALPVPEKWNLLRPVAGAVLMLGVGLLISQQLGEEALVIAVAMGVVVGVVLHLLIDQSSVDTVRIGLATILSIGLATVSFAAARGLGMALALIAAAGILLISGNRRALLSLGPLVGLVLYRVLREEGTGATRALDIGQHYTLLALALGAIIPLMFIDWRGKVHLPSTIGSALWGVLGLTVPPLVITMFGARGAVGFMVGIGMAASIEAIRRGQNLAIYSVVTIFAPATLFALQWMANADDLSRDQKIPVLVGAGILILALSTLLAWFSAPKAAETAS